MFSPLSFFIITLILLASTSLLEALSEFSVDIYRRLTKQLGASLDELGFNVSEWQVGDNIFHYPPTVTKYQAKEMVENYLVHFDSKQVCLASSPIPRESTVFFIPAALVVKNSSADKRKMFKNMDEYHRDVYPMIAGKTPSPFLNTGKLLQGHTDEYVEVEDTDTQPTYTNASPLYPVGG